MCGRYSITTPAETSEDGAIFASQPAKVNRKTATRAHSAPAPQPTGHVFMTPALQNASGTNAPAIRIFIAIHNIAVRCLPFGEGPAGRLQHLPGADQTLRVAWPQAPGRRGIAPSELGVQGPAADRPVMLARGLAHSLRNPLNVLGLTIEELSSPALDCAARERLATAARGQIGRVDRTLQGLLALASGGVGETGPVCIDDLARDVVLELLQDVRHSARIAVEAAIRQPWDRLLRDGDDFVGMDGFGASGPAGDLYAHFGITADAVAARARAMIG